jgi:hypothetical protein
MLGPDFDPAHTAVVEADVPALTDGAAFESMTPMPTPTIHRPDTDRVDVDTDLSRPSLLVVSEQFFPGWKASLDGVPTDLLRVNGVLMGTVVPEGRHRVTLRFQPAAITIGFRIALATLALVILLWVVDRRHASTRKNSDQSPVVS